MRISLAVDQLVADTIELTEYLWDRFGEKKIYLLGESWGTTLAVLAAQQRPDLYVIVIGSGQMVSELETDRRIYHDLLNYAVRDGDQPLAAQLLEIDFHRDVPKLDTAVYILDGAAKLDARRDLALEWYELLNAPLKSIYTFDHVAHAPAFEQFAGFTQIMTETAIHETDR